ncbi:hypothetical protein AYO22_02632 [Fonsecaea multimorphosa]|nr:hypothetical protein AYO22_02632 [Fonsecaea multimorphosa]
MSRRSSTIDDPLLDHWICLDEDEPSASLRLVDSFGIFLHENEFQEVLDANSSNAEEVNMDSTQVIRSFCATANEKQFLNMVACNIGGKLVPQEWGQGQPAVSPIPFVAETATMNPSQIMKSACTSANKRILPNPEASATTDDENSQQPIRRSPIATPITNNVDTKLGKRGQERRPLPAVQKKAKLSRLWVTDDIFRLDKKSFTDAIAILQDDGEDEERFMEPCLAHS